MNISVCMATYNGGTYIKDQLDSILSQISSNDEIVIVDDCSTDDTIDLIRSYADDRIKLFRNSKNIGSVHSFEKSISLAVGEYIFLSDQDDIWCKNRLNIMKEALKNSNVLLLSTKFSYIDENTNCISGKSVRLSSNDSNKYIGNILGVFLKKRSYFGCAMAFKSNFRNIILPIPSYVKSHDLWIAFAANLSCSNLHLEYISLYHRIHGNNQSLKPRAFYKKVWIRILFVISVIHLLKRIYINN